MSTDPTRDHNTKHRKEQIAASMERLYRLDSEIDALVDEHIAALREDKTEIKKRLREDFNMPAKLVQARYAAYRLERTAQDASDDVTLDAIREMFEYVPIGGQGSLLPAFEIDAPPAPPKAPAMTAEQAEAMGAAAFGLNEAEDAFPPTVKTKKLRLAWLKGWQGAMDIAGQSDNSGYDDRR